MTKPHTSVLVIGAGLAGLAAAKELIEHDVEVRIIEARERIGGRLHTVDDDYDFPVELGAEFVHGKPPEVWDVINDERITAYDTSGNHWWRRGNEIMASEKFYQELDQILSAMVDHFTEADSGGAERERSKQAPDDLSFKEYLDKYCAAASEEAKAIARRYVQGFDAADDEQASAQALARENAVCDKIGGDIAFRLLDGYDSLVGHFGGRLNSEQLILNTPISSIQWKNGSVQVMAQDATGSVLSFIGSHAIITLPLGVLQLKPGEKGFVSFDPPLPASDALHLLRMGKVVKVILRFRERFWEAIEVSTEEGGSQSFWDLGFAHCDREFFPTWWTQLPLRVPLMVGWCAGPAAERLASLDAQTIRKEALAGLAQLTGKSTAQLEQLLEAFHYHDWTNDPYARGAYSYVAVGGAGVAKRLMEPIDGTLFLAGEHTDSEGYAATVHGAIRSGLRAANQLLATLRNG